MEIYWKKGDFSLADLEKELGEMKDSFEKQKNWWDNVYPTLGIEYDAMGECLIFQETERQIKYLKNQIALAKNTTSDLKD
jgi:hypothetical protein